MPDKYAKPSEDIWLHTVKGDVFADATRVAVDITNGLPLCTKSGDVQKKVG